MEKFCGITKTLCSGFFCIATNLKKTKQMILRNLVGISRYREQHNLLAVKSIMLWSITTLMLKIIKPNSIIHYHAIIY